MSSSSGGAKVDPEKLEEFASRLSQHARWFDSEMGRMSSILGALESWRDDEFETFKNEFERAKDNVSSFVYECERASVAVRNDAARAREIQKIKP